MTIENDFLPFAAGAGANVLTQAQYAALTSLIANGFSAGVAPSAQLNKVWRQSSIMAAVLAQFIVANTGQTAIDDGTTATLLANLATAISVTARQNPVLADTGAANAYVVSNLAAFTAYPTSSGLTLDVSIANANTGASTLNVDGLGAKPILGLGLQPLQGGELVAKGVACLLYVVASTVNSGNGAWVVMECSGGAQQVAPAAQSQQAVNLGQVTSTASPLQLATQAATAVNHAVNQGQAFGLGQSLQNVTGSRALGTTYTNSTGRAIVVVVTMNVSAGQSSTFNLNGTGVGALNNVGSSTTSITGTFIVLPGQTYSVTTSGGSISAWYELR